MEEREKEREIYRSAVAEYALSLRVDLISQSKKRDARMFRGTTLTKREHLVLCLVRHQRHQRMLSVILLAHRDVQHRLCLPTLSIGLFSHFPSGATTFAAAQCRHKQTTNPGEDGRINIFHKYTHYPYKEHTHTHGEIGGTAGLKFTPPTGVCQNAHQALISVLSASCDSRQ